MALIQLKWPNYFEAGRAVPDVWDVSEVSPIRCYGKNRPVADKQTLFEFAVSPDDTFKCSSWYNLTPAR